MEFNLQVVGVGRSRSRGGTIYRGASATLSAALAARRRRGRSQSRTGPTGMASSESRRARGHSAAGVASAGSGQVDKKSYVEPPTCFAIQASLPSLEAAVTGPHGGV